MERYGSLKKKNPDCKPTLSWWISLPCQKLRTDEINILFIELQYERFLVSHQREAFDQLNVRLRYRNLKVEVMDRNVVC
jgi:hypothetical protein